MTTRLLQTRKLLPPHVDELPHRMHIVATISRQIDELLAAGGCYPIRIRLTQLENLNLKQWHITAECMVNTI